MLFFKEFYLRSSYFTILTLFFVFCSCLSYGSEPIIRSLETPYTIMYVREANMGGESHIIASGYDGEVVCLDYEGNIKWMTEFDGYLNQDVCCYDIDGDGRDEVLAASADGNLYVLDDNGDKLWSFKANEIPLYSVAAMKCDNEVVIAVGGFDKNIYFLTPSNDLLKTVKSTEYAVTKGWGEIKNEPAQGSINFLRTVKDENGIDLLAVHGTVSANDGGGALYIFDVDIKNKDYKVLTTFPSSATGTTTLSSHPVGYMTVNSEVAGVQKVLLGKNDGLVEADYNAKTIRQFCFSEEEYWDYAGIYVPFGYRNAHVEAVSGLRAEDDYNYIMFVGSSLIVLDQDLNWTPGVDLVDGNYSYNDMYVDQKNMKMVLASCQSGGNCVHVVDLKQKNWLERFKTFAPSGNISKVLTNSGDLRAGAERFVKPSWESERPMVYMMSESATLSPIEEYVNKYPSTMEFLASKHDPCVQSPESWNRDKLSNVVYRNTRDNRRTYSLTAKEAVEHIIDNYPGLDGYVQEGKFTYPEGTGALMNAGHGMDPFFFSPQTWETALSQVGSRKSMLLYMELPTNPDENFQYVMDSLFIPLADMRKKGRDVQVVIRNKNIFWLSGIYTKYWEQVASGEYADAFVPSMEETSARTQDVSIAARVGFWASKAVDVWSTNCSRDNPSHDRLRQQSHQMIPNHFLRNCIYNMSLGCSYIDNYAVDQEYMSLLWDLIGKGVVYIPKRDELISLSPVHLAMDYPDEEFLIQGDNNKWTVLLDPVSPTSTDKYVFNRLGSSWTSAPVPEWDFSKYAAGVDDRRTNFLPPYENGMVLITPGEVQTDYRAHISQLLHPIYRDIMKTYHTDGKNYIVNGAKVSPKTYYKTIQADIKASAEKLPLTVGGGEVAWVAAHSAPKHIRLTIVDGGYINPDDAVAKVKFNSVDPVSITDLITGEKFFANGEKEFEISVPTGMARFLDVEIKEEL